MTFSNGFLSLYIAVTYFVSAIPFGLVVATVKGVDLRSIGSGNIGATNVYRAMGIKYAVIVFLLDGLKGWGATALVMLLTSNPVVHVVIGSIAIIGHSLSFFVKFRGGKGAATGIGVICALSPIICLIVVVIAALLIYVTRYVSLATVICSILTPILFVGFGYPSAYIVMLSLIGLFIIYRHRENIKRLIQKKENKI